MTATARRPVARIALAAALVAALGLGACGRKGPLDPPPAAQVQGEQGQPAEPQPLKHDRAGNPLAPPGEKKPFFLDFLLN